MCLTAIPWNSKPISTHSDGVQGGAETVRLLFLDRDGTLNRSLGHRPPNSPEEVELLPGVGPVLSRYAQDGWRMVIVTNQGGVAGGYLGEAQARAVLQRVVDLLPVPVAAAYLCPHMAGARVAAYDLDCPNRKPRPGFILQALRAHDARPEDCLFVGDSITDQGAARAAAVPFCWADRFFGWPIDRGMQTRRGTWLQVRADRVDGEGELVLVALVRGKPAGRLRLWSADPATRAVALDVHVPAAHRRRGIGSALMYTALEWAREQSWARAYVDVAPDDSAALAFADHFDFRRASGDLESASRGLGPAGQSEPTAAYSHARDL
jgi:D-glycero-D-manno-heptose 1,7-bisphosphate phosphatase